ncbi:unnamed protein product, partial [Brachionus calyciflorus]
LFTINQNNSFLTRIKLNTQPKRSNTAQAESEPTNIINILQKKLTENKSKNILVYSCNSGGSIRVNILGVIGSVILLGASYNTWYIFSSFRFKNRKIDSESGFLSGILNIIGSEYFKIALCSTTALIGISILIVTMFFTSRSVNKLYLLKGGHGLGIVTDGVFGREMKFVLDMEKTTFNATRKSRTSQVTFKNKKHFSYFLMNNIEGVYHEKEIFDHVICTKR